jgi:hypothetical protein
LVVVAWARSLNEVRVLDSAVALRCGELVADLFVMGRPHVSLVRTWARRFNLSIHGLCPLAESKLGQLATGVGVVQVLKIEVTNQSVLVRARDLKFGCR